MKPSNQSADHIRKLGLDPGRLLPCDSQGCIHYAEGCGLGYPMDMLGRHPDEDVQPVVKRLLEKDEVSPDLAMICSAAFEDFWAAKLGPRLRHRVLPCSHSTPECDPMGECVHLSRPDMISSHYLFRMRLHRDLSKGSPRRVSPFTSALRQVREFGSVLLNLPESESSFVASLAEDIARHSAHRSHRERDLSVLDFLIHTEPASVRDAATALLQECLASDDNHFISEATGFLYATLPKTEELAKVLDTGFSDRTKSNRLRERFFWVFNYNFPQESRKFFVSNLTAFLRENADNVTLAADILDFLHWRFSTDDPIPADVRSAILSYITEHPEVNEHISSSTRLLLGPA